MSTQIGEENEEFYFLCLFSTIVSILIKCPILHPLHLRTFDPSKVNLIIGDMERLPGQMLTFGVMKSFWIISETLDIYAPRKEAAITL